VLGNRERSRTSKSCGLRAAIVGLALLAGGDARVRPDDKEPQDLGLTEWTGRILAQLDVALEGPPEEIGDLAIQDFKLFVDGKPVTPVALDNLCTVSRPGGDTEPPPASSPTTYLFYLDQRSMTLGGRLSAFETVEAMAQRLIRGGNRGAVISSGKKLATFAGFTASPAPLAEALSRVRDDPQQWDEYASLEESRYREIRLAGSVESACMQARIHQREERRRTEAALDLFIASLSRLADVPPPKVAIYFADIVRDDPGHHYIDAATGGRAFLRSACEMQTFDARFIFRRVHEAAAALGVKVYAVQAQGLVSPELSEFRDVANLAARDAQSGLKVLTLATGGDAFLNGASVERMVEKVRSDAACTYLLSLDPAPFPEDRPLPVRLEVKRRKVQAHTRTHIVIQSESNRRIGKLMAAFVSSSGLEGTLPMQGGVIPIGVEDGRLRALVQASLPATLVVQEEWDVGMSLIAGTGVRDQASSRITVDRPGTRLVLEAEMELRRGPFEIALVGLENVTGTVASGRVIGSWSPGDATVQVAPIAVVQPTEGIFVRGGNVQHEGPLVIPQSQSVLRDRPTAIVTVVCRVGKKVLRVERALRGDTSTTFSPVELPAGGEPCLQVRDVIPAGTLVPGNFTYSLVAGTEVQAERNFVVE